jgi:bifunctional aspartokinase / homoserine dehydrogenase 1
MAEKTLVMKFGGTSVGSPEALNGLASIVALARKDWPRVAVVVSAMSGVTDLLLNGATAAVQGDTDSVKIALEAIRAKHTQALDAASLGEREWNPIAAYLTELNGLYHAISVLGEATPRALDAIASLGERMSIHVVSGYLRAAGVPSLPVEATSFLVTDDKFQSASPYMEEVGRLAKPLFEPFFLRNETPVVTGFIGATREHVITTLGRGGSDYSGAILGAALDADEVWIWTDVDGVMTADPRQVPEARNLPTLSYREVSELAYYGAKVVHPKTIKPCLDRNIALRIKNTFHPEHPGTEIVSNGKQTASVVKAVTAIREQLLVTVQGGGMMGVPGIAGRTFGAVARLGVSVSMITQASSEQSICFSVPGANGKAVQTALEEELRREIDRGDIDAVALRHSCVIVTVVGSGMQTTPGISGRIFSALGNANVNVLAIAQGSSECSISLVVTAEDAVTAIRAIHSLILAEQSAIA